MLLLHTFVLFASLFSSFATELPLDVHYESAATVADTLLDDAITHKSELHSKEPIVAAESIAETPRASDAASIDASEPQCSPMSDKTLVFSQEDALQSNNLLLRAATELINQHLDGIVNVDLGLRGDTLQGHRVGTFEITARIRHLTASGSEATDCFLIPYEIKDVDECLLPAGHAMRHVCHATAACRNTQGSYECACEKGGWAARGSGSFQTPTKLASYVKSLPRFSDGYGPQNGNGGGSCGGERSTEACCGGGSGGDSKVLAACHDSSPSACAANCKADFRCTKDPCLGTNCGPHARCEAGSGGYGSYECVCDAAYQMGSEGKCVAAPPKPKPDPCGGHKCPGNCRCDPTDATVANSTYHCLPKPGFVAFTDPKGSAARTLTEEDLARRLDGVTACVSAKAPTLAVNGPSPYRLKQGESYSEFGCSVVDDNEEDDERVVKIQYSEPFGAYFTNTGEYSVSYSVETPWLPVKSVAKVRRIIVSDVDECSYDGKIAAFRHNCVKIAACVNLDGSYACRCPDGYAGDGLLGGSGCADVRKPVLECRGRGCEPAKYRAINAVGIASADSFGGYRGGNGGDGGNHGGNSNGRVFISDGADDAFVEAQLLRLGAAVFCEAGSGGGGSGAAESPGAAGAAAAAESLAVGGGGDGGGGGKSSGSGVCFAARDVTFEGTVDLTASIVRGPLEPVPGKKGAWQFPYDVKDAAGNRAERVYYIIQVETVSWLDAMRGAGMAASSSSLLQRLLGPISLLLFSSSGGEAPEAWLWSVLAAVAMFWLLGKVLSAARTALRAVQYVLSPYSLVRSREDFDAAYGLVLRVQSLGMLGEKERQRRTAAKWLELLDTAGGDGVDGIGVDDGDATEDGD